jgi:colanic acid/amylovoran biosynthesis glycosyltransferase
MTTSASSDSDIIVAHSVVRWLPLTETWLYNQVRFLPEHIVNHVMCERTENLDQFLVGNIHDFSLSPKIAQYYDRTMRRLGFRHYLKYLLRCSTSLGADVLHSHFGHVGWANMEAARKAGMKHVVTFYGLDVNYLPQEFPHWRDRYTHLFSHADRILCEGPHMAESVRRLGCPEGKVLVHHLGVDLDGIPFVPRSWNGTTPLEVLIAASFREKKGIPYALEALGHLQHEVPLEITLVGDANGEERNQREKRRILEVIERYRLGGRIRMPGYLSHAELMAAAYGHHVFLAPSVTAGDGDSEGGAPVALIEMLASGMPIVSTRHCDIPGIIRDGETGYLAGERDVEGLLDQLRKVVKSRSDWSEMAARGRRHVEQEFNARKQGERLAGLYRKMVV